MNDKNKPRPAEPETVPCEVCLKEVPLSEAKNVEANDYMLHFCGMDCYDKWQKGKGKNSR